MFFRLKDPDPLVTRYDPAPDPSIIKQKQYLPKPDPHPNPDPLVRVMDPQIRIRKKKISWIRNTGTVSDDCSWWHLHNIK
jgi:hypothetical protein